MDRLRMLLRMGCAPQLLHEQSCLHKKGGGTTVVQPQPVPDPKEQVSAEAKVNRYNVRGPGGTQFWEGPEAPENTLVQTLDPSQQRQFDSVNQIAEQLIGRAGSQIPQIPASPFSFGKNFSYNDATPEAAKAQFQKQIALMMPEYKKQDENFETRMANAGIPIGSEAYNDAMRQHENDRNFAISNAALDATTAGTSLAASERNINSDESLRQRQQNYNELAALLGGQQLTPLQASGGTGPLDVSGAFNNAQNVRNANYQGQINNANVSQSGSNAMTSGLFALGSAAAIAF